MKLVAPHIHKTLGDAGFFAKVSKKGEIRELRVNVLEGLRQIEGILIGRRVFETPLVISRICGICPISHLLNACLALEKAMEVKVSSQTVLLRKLLQASQIIQSHTLHIFFMSLADFLNIDNDVELVKKFPKESKAALQIRDFSLKLIEAVGGRTVHPMTPAPGGFTKLPDREKLKKILKEYDKSLENSLVLIDLFKGLFYPDLKRETRLCSSFSQDEYSHYNGKKIKIEGKLFSPGDFFSNQVEEDLKEPPLKKVKFRGKPYMLGAAARVKNNEKLLDPEIKSLIEEFKKKKKEKGLFENTFYNTFFQALEVRHFLKEAGEILKQLAEERGGEPIKKFKIKKGSGLGIIEAPRGTLFTYLEIDNKGRISDCNIITPTAQFLLNLEADLKTLLPQIMELPQEKKIRRIKTLIRAYDPCISCAVH